MPEQLVKTEAMNLRERGKGCMRGSGGRDVKGGMTHLKYNLKNKQKSCFKRNPNPQHVMISLLTCRNFIRRPADNSSAPGCGVKL